MKLIGFTTSYNESDMIPYVMPYVERLGYDKFIVYDNMSTDNTVELLKKYPFVEVRTFDTNGVFSEEAKRDIQLNAYLESYAMANIDGDNEESVWMTFTDFDEVLFYHEPFSNLFKPMLQTMADDGYNYFSGKMVNLLPPKNSNKITLNEGGLVHSVEGVRGQFWNGGCKPTLLYVNDITYYNPSYGNHKCEVKTRNGKALKKIYDFIAPFHLRWIDKERLLKRNITFSIKGFDLCDNMNTPDSIRYNYENYLYPTSFSLEQYFYDNFKNYKETIYKL